MNLDTQFKIRNNPQYQKYIRENSNWYKVLNRDSTMFRMFEEQVKTDYKLRPEDRINKVIQTVDFLQTILATLK